jgi:hypothetical protein
LTDFLPIPEEPIELKVALRSLIDAEGKKAKYIVFTGNKLPKYLWDKWQDDLRRHNLTWQNLLKSVSRHSGEALEWITGERSWISFIKLIIEDLRAQAEGRLKPVERRKAKTLTDFL